MSKLGDRLLAIHAALDAANLAHAFGGAIALAYCTQEPRGTRDIDVNVFVGADRARLALDAMPPGVTVGPADHRKAERDGQVRLMWDDTPVDVFLDTHAFHRDVAEQVVEVPFEGTEIPVLSCQALIVFKAMFNRTRHWADIEAMLEAGIDARRPLKQLRGLLGDDDSAVARLTRLLGQSL